MKILIVLHSPLSHSARYHFTVIFTYENVKILETMRDFRFFHTKNLPTSQHQQRVKENRVFFRLNVIAAERKLNAREWKFSVKNLLCCFSSHRRGEATSWCAREPCVDFERRVKINDVARPLSLPLSRMFGLSHMRIAYVCTKIHASQTLRSRRQQCSRRGGGKSQSCPVAVVYQSDSIFVSK